MHLYLCHVDACLGVRPIKMSVRMFVCTFIEDKCMHVLVHIPLRHVCVCLCALSLKTSVSMFWCTSHEDVCVYVYVHFH